MKKLLLGMFAYTLLATAVPAVAMQPVRGEQCVQCHTRRAVPCQRAAYYAQPAYVMPVAAPVMAIPQAVCGCIQPMCRPLFGFGASLNLPFIGFGFRLGL